MPTRGSEGRTCSAGLRPAFDLVNKDRLLFKLETIGLVVGFSSNY